MKNTAFMMMLAAVMLVAGSVQAQEAWPKWYVGIQGSLPFVSESDVSIAGANVGDLEYEVGWGLGASLGYRPGSSDTPLLNGFRFEVEYTHRENDFDTLAGVSVSDDLESDALMFNALYDIETGSKFIPYLGAGIGYASLEANSNILGFSSEDDSVFAYQFMGGVGYAPEMLHNTVWSIGYRYFSTSDPEFSGFGGTAEIDYDVHNIELGARFMF